MIVAFDATNDDSTPADVTDESAIVGEALRHSNRSGIGDGNEIRVEVEPYELRKAYRRFDFFVNPPSPTVTFLSSVAF